MEIKQIVFNGTPVMGPAFDAALEQRIKRHQPRVYSTGPMPYVEDQPGSFRKLLEHLHAERAAWRSRGNVRYPFKVTLRAVCGHQDVNGEFVRGDDAVLSCRWFRSERVANAYAERLSAKHTSSMLPCPWVQIDNVVTGESRPLAQGTHVGGVLTFKLGERLGTLIDRPQMRIGLPAEGA